MFLFYINSLSHVFRHGYWVATNPKKTILASMAVVMICGIGILNFHNEANMVKLWIPRDSDFARNNEWLWNNYPPDWRCVIN